MSEREFNAIFSERLRYYLNKYEITQLELSKRLDVGTTSVYNWCNGIKTPRMDKVDAMCQIFHCKRSDLMEEPSTDQSGDRTSKVSILRRAEENETLTEEQLDDILSYAKYRYPNAFKDNE